jgi:uncharacterized protein
MNTESATVQSAEADRRPLRSIAPFVGPLTAQLASLLDCSEAVQDGIPDRHAGGGRRSGVGAPSSLSWGRTPVLFAALCATILMLALAAASLAQPSQPPSPSKPRFRVLALAESGGHHIAFTEAARPWLKKLGEEHGFEVDYVTNTAPVTEGLLARYRLVLQLDFAPYGWKPEAMSAFKSYIEQGKGGWVGLHHATLLGEFDGYPMWPWFSAFMGNIRYKNYIPEFASGAVHVEDKSHPCVKDVPESFVIPKEEWYTWDRSPRQNVHVLASVDEATYSPASDVKMGDHPVIWTNEHVAARNVYIFMGHGPDLLENRAFTTILRNAILWAAGK